MLDLDSDLQSVIVVTVLSAFMESLVKPELTVSFRELKRELVSSLSD